MGLIFLEPDSDQTPVQFAKMCDLLIFDYLQDSKISYVDLEWCGNTRRLALFYSDGQKCWTPPLDESFYLSARPVFEKYKQCINEG